MSSRREPMWYCHECHAEMRPLMVPDPHCASCNGTFVEKIEDEVDDPRAFQTSGPPLDDHDAPADLGFNTFLLNLSQLLNPSGIPRGGPSSGQTPSNANGPDVGGRGIRIEMTHGSPGSGTRTYVLGGPQALGGSRRQPGSPTGNTNAENEAIAGPLMAQYLLSMLSQRSQREGRDDPFGGFNIFGGAGMPQDGRWGDYVFNQEALDQIITQMMENSNSSRPVPATEEVIGKLDRQVLEEGSHTLERDCAVCKEQFSLQTEDPDEQVVVTLPCKHPFHEGCIMPWLKSSGTCPVCRFQLVPQPEHHAPGPAGGSGSSPAAGSPPGGGVFGNLFNMMGGSGAGASGAPPSTSDTQSRSPPSGGNPPQPHDRSSSSGEPPGGWWD